MPESGRTPTEFNLGIAERSKAGPFCNFRMIICFPFNVSNNLNWIKILLALNAN